MMSVLQNAFANTSSAFMTAKVTGSISVLLLVILGITNLTINYIWTFIFLVSGGFALSCIGIIAGIWAQKFDQLAIVSNFVVQPLAFLSGTFYSIERLPETLKIVAYCNPIFYAIDGL